MILVVGATNSSNSNRLREIGSEAGLPSYLIADGSELDAGVARRRRRRSALPPAPRRPKYWSRTSSTALRRLGPVDVSTAGRPAGEHRIPSAGGTRDKLAALSRRCAGIDRKRVG